MKSPSNKIAQKNKQLGVSCEPMELGWPTWRLGQFIENWIKSIWQETELAGGSGRERGKIVDL